MKNLVENLFLTKELYQTILSPVCAKYNITHTEVMVLLFLDNYPTEDTATDIVEKLRLTKSAISTATRSLQEKGLITGKFTNGNRRSIHLKLCDNAEEIVKAGNKAQHDFFEVIVKGFNEDEITEFKDYYKRITENISEYHRNDREV